MESKRKLWISVSCIVVALVLCYAYCQKAKAEEGALAIMLETNAKADAIRVAPVAVPEVARPETVTVITQPILSYDTPKDYQNPVLYRPSYTQADTTTYNLTGPTQIQTFPVKTE